MKADKDMLKEARKSVLSYKRDAANYESASETWKKDHAAAMRCFRLEELLARGLTLFDYLNRIDEAWRKRVFRKEVNYDADINLVITKLYRKWHEVCPRVLEYLAEMEKHFQVEGAKEFRAACQEVQGMLTPDEEFFVDEKLIKLRDRAVDAHRQDRTEEMERMTN